MEEYRGTLYAALVNGKLNINEKNGIIEYSIKSKINKNKIMKILYVPDVLRNRIIDYAHWNQMNSHIGEDQTILWIEKRFWWEDYRRQIRLYVKTCDTCQRCKGSIRRVGYLEPLFSEKPRQWIMCDYAGPFHGILYFLLIVDHFTGYCVACPAWGTGAEEAMYLILNNWICMFGWYEIISSDRGSAFIDELNQRLHKLFGIKYNLAQARNHRSVGKVERVIRIFKEKLQLWNVELQNLLVNNKNKIEACEGLITSSKTIQAGMNARISRVHQLSANQLMFGDDIAEWPDSG